MVQFTVVINDVEEKALLTDMISVQEWLDNAIHEKARRTINTIVSKISDKQPKKMSVKEKFQIIKKATLETAIERNTRLEAELLAEMRKKK